MPDYSKGKIYTIRSYSNPDLIYVGSTTQPLSKRLVDHKRNYKSYLNQKGNYVSSFKLLECDNCYIELVENCECKCKEELDEKKKNIKRIIKKY
jgi:hypothetical protein